VKIRKKQCKACPWKKSTVPERDIPGGYCPKLHAGLKSTIAPGVNEQLVSLGRENRAMACHESYGNGSEYPCVGWLVHQLGPGNNIGLRLAALDGRFEGLQTDGPQHERFEDTLPKEEKDAEEL
jgi:hypothetical protein